MDFANPLPSIAVIVACLLTACAIVAFQPFFRARVLESGGGRYEGLDGLRGFLAIGVFFAHVINTYFYATEGRWGGYSIETYGSTGEAGVALFFMITGFLFWGRVLRSGNALDTLSLYRSRLRRIVPMYLASVLMVLLVVAAASGFRLHDGPLDLLRDLRPWLSFGFMDTGDLNNLEGARYINPIYWTLAFEWAFYVSLPFLALFSRGRSSLMLLVIALFFGQRLPVTLNFIFGALTAVAMERGLLDRRLSSAWFTPLPLAALFLGMQFSYSLQQSSLLFVFFVFVVAGNSLYGLLSTASAKLLGAVSYSFYLMHAIVLYLVMHIVDAQLSIASLSPGGYWFFVGLAAVLVVMLSALTFRYIEYPWFASHAAGASTANPPALGVAGARQAIKSAAAPLSGRKAAA